jgi:hypothetical protein
VLWKGSWISSDVNSAVASPIVFIIARTDGGWYKAMTSRSHAKQSTIRVTNASQIVPQNLRSIRICVDAIFKLQFSLVPEETFPQIIKSMHVFPR